MSWTWWDSDGVILHVSHLFSSCFFLEHAGIQVDLCCLLSARLFRHDLEVCLEVHVEQQNTETEKIHVQKYRDGSGIHHPEHTQPPPPPQTCWWTWPLAETPPGSAPTCRWERLPPEASVDICLRGHVPRSPRLSPVKEHAEHRRYVGGCRVEHKNGGWGALAFKKRCETLLLDLLTALVQHLSTTVYAFLRQMLSMIQLMAFLHSWSYLRLTWFWWRPFQAF